MRCDVRPSGVPLIGDLTWGSRFCQFYETKEDLLEILVPYIKAGLEGNEACLWVTREPLTAADALQALARALPRLDSCVKSGQLEVVGEGARPADTELSARLDRAVSRGFDGLRLAHQAVPPGDARPPTQGEAGPSRLFNVLEACAYPRDRFDALRLLEVAKVHRFALVRNSGRWERVVSSEASVAQAALEHSEAKLEALFKSMSEGFAYHRIVLDGRGRPCDYVFLEVSGSFERLTGLKGVDIVGRRATEVLPGLDKDPTDWIGRYGSVALTGEPARFESRSEALGKWFAVSAFSPYKGFFAVTFSDITERKRGEEALRRSHAALAEAERIAGIGSWEWDVASGQVLWSEQMYRIFGVKPGAFTPSYSEFFARVHPDDRARLEEVTRQALARCQPFAMEHRVSAGPGVVKVLMSQAEVMAGPDGAPRRVIGTVLDITARKQAEEEAAQARDTAEARAAELQAVLDVASVAVWIAHDPQCLRITGNQAADELVMRVARGANISASARPGDAAASYRVFQDGTELKPEELPSQVAAATGKPVDEAELELRFSDGRSVQMLMGAVPLFDAEGRVRGSVAAGMDVSERRRAEVERERLLSELRQRAAELDTVFSVLPYLVSVHGPDGAYRRANPAMVKLFGFDPTGMKREEVAARVKAHFADGRPLIPDNMPSSEALRGSPAANQEYIVSDAEGRERILLINALPLKVDGQVRGMVLAQVDITERKRSEEALRRHSEELRASNEELERFNLSLVDREQRMIELKQEVNALLGRLGQPAAYACDLETEAP